MFRKCAYGLVAACPSIPEDGLITQAKPFSPPLHEIQRIGETYRSGGSPDGGDRRSSRRSGQLLVWPREQHSSLYKALPLAWGKTKRAEAGMNNAARCEVDLRTAQGRRVFHSCCLGSCPEQMGCIYCQFEQQVNSRHARGGLPHESAVLQRSPAALLRAAELQDSVHGLPD